MKKSDKDKITAIMVVVTIILVASFLICIRVFPDKTESRKETALIVEAGKEYEINPFRFQGSIWFHAEELDPQYYIVFEVDGETYKVIGSDVYNAYKDNIGDSVEVVIKTYHYPFISKFEKKVNLPVSE